MRTNCSKLYINLLEENQFFLSEGKYAYIESSYRQKGDRAELISKSMSGTKCMHFMYNMRGIYMGRIDVVQNYGQVRKVLLSLSGNHDRPWRKAFVDIPDVAQPYKVRNILRFDMLVGFMTDLSKLFNKLKQTCQFHLMAKSVC